MLSMHFKHPFYDMNSYLRWCTKEGMCLNRKLEPIKSIISQKNWGKKYE